METQDIRNAFYDTLEYLRSSEMQGVLIRTRKNTLLYPDNFCTWHHKPLCDGKVMVIDRSPVETCEKYGKDYKTAILMTGDAENPGESARKGIENSESELCICTSFYPCLTSTEQGEAFYAMNARVNRGAYTDRVLYVREVPVIKTKSGKQIPFEKRTNVDIMVIAVPESADSSLYKNRIKNMFDVAIEEGVKVIILDAFHKQNKEAKVIAKAYEEMIQEGHYEDQFEKIIFAIPEYETRMIFASTFGTKEEIPSITPVPVKKPEVVPMPEVVELPTPEPVIAREMAAAVEPEKAVEVTPEPEQAVEETPVEPVVKVMPTPVVPEEVKEPEVTVEPEPVVETEPETVEQVEESVAEPEPVSEPVVEETLVETTPEPEVVAEPEVAVEEPVVEETPAEVVQEPVIEETPEPEEVTEPEVTVEPEVIEETPVEPVVESEPETVEQVEEPVAEPEPVSEPVVEETPVETTPEPEVVEEPVQPVEVTPEPVVEPVVEERPAPSYRYTVREEQESVPAEPIPVMPVIEEMPSVKKESPTEQLDDVVDLGSISFEPVVEVKKEAGVLDRCVKTKVIRESKAFTSYEAELDGKDVVVTIYGYEPSQAAMSKTLFDRFEKLGSIHARGFTEYPCVEMGDDEIVVIAEKEPDGMPLEKLAGKLSNERALHYMQQVVEGVKVLYEHGLPVDVVSPANYKVTMDGNIWFIAGRIRTMKNAPVLDDDKKFMIPRYTEDEVESSLYAIGAMTYYLLNGTMYSEEGVREHIAGDPEHSAVYRMIYFCCTDIEQIRIKGFESLIEEIEKNK